MKRINLRVIWNLLKKHIKSIGLVILGTAVLAAGATALLTDDAYVSTCSVYAMIVTRDDLGNAVGITSATFDNTDRMVDEFVEIITSESVLVDTQTLLHLQGYDVSYEYVCKALSVTGEKDTALINITATTDNPDLSQKMCEAVKQYAITKLETVMLGLGTITLVNNASLGVKQSAPILRNGLLGAVVGVILAFIVLLCLYFLNDTIKDEQDFKNRFDIHLLGVVPTLPGRAQSIRRDKKGVFR